MPSCLVVKPETGKEGEGNCGGILSTEQIPLKQRIGLALRRKPLSFGAGVGRAELPNPRDEFFCMLLIFKILRSKG